MDNKKPKKNLAHFSNKLNDYLSFLSLFIPDMCVLKLEGFSCHFIKKENSNGFLSRSTSPFKWRIWYNVPQSIEKKIQMTNQKWKNSLKNIVAMGRTITMLIITSKHCTLVVKKKQTTFKYSHHLIHVHHKRAICVWMTWMQNHEMRILKGT